jgi:GNAT superfamily N-acetyltransferase
VVTKAKIREAAEADAAALTSLLDELGYPASERQTGERLQRLLADPGQRVLVAELEGEIAGVAVVQIYCVLTNDHPDCLLDVLVVAGRARRRGVGMALVEAVEEEARRRGCYRVVLESGNWRGDAHDFYRALGYENVARGFHKLL